MLTVNVILLIFINKILASSYATGQFTPAVNTNITLTVLTIEDNARFIEQQVIFDTNNQNEAKKALTVQTKVTRIALIDARFIGYDVLKVIRCEQTRLFIIGKTPQNSYFIGRVATADNGNIIYIIVIKSWHIILDMSCVSLPADPQKNAPVGSRKFYLYWLEKEDNITVYRTLYRFPMPYNDSKQANYQATYYTQRWHQFPFNIEDATIATYDKDPTIFIATISANEVMFVKLQSLYKSSVPLIHSSYHYRQCTFMSKLTAFNAENLIVLVNCALNNTHYHQGMIEQKNNYLIVDVLNRYSPSSAFDGNSHVPRQLPTPKNYVNFRWHWNTVIANNTSENNIIGLPFFGLINADENTNIFLYKNGVGSVVKSDLLPDGAAMGPGSCPQFNGKPCNHTKIYPFALRAGHMLLLTRGSNHLLPDNIAFRPPIFPSQSKQPVTHPPDTNTTTNRKGFIYDKYTITVKCMTNTESDHQNNNTALINTVDIWILIILVVFGLMLFVLILAVLFIIRKL